MTFTCLSLVNRSSVLLKAPEDRFSLQISTKNLLSSIWQVVIDCESLSGSPDWGCFGGIWRWVIIIQRCLDTQCHFSEECRFRKASAGNADQQNQVEGAPENSHRYELSVYSPDLTRGYQPGKQLSFYRTTGNFQRPYFVSLFGAGQSWTDLGKLSTGAQSLASGKQNWGMTFSWSSVSRINLKLLSSWKGKRKTLQQFTLSVHFSLYTWKEVHKVNPWHWQ